MVTPTTFALSVKISDKLMYERTVINPDSCRNVLLSTIRVEQVAYNLSEARTERFMTSPKKDYLTSLEKILAECLTAKRRNVIMITQFET